MYYATARDMERLDRMAVARGLDVRQMMELAGWHMVSLFRQLRISQRSSVAVVVGKGNKGGDGLSAARHLANYGWNVSVILLSDRISNDAMHHLRLVRQMNIPVMRYAAHKTRARAAIERSDVVIDALIGYHLNGPPRDAFAEVIEIMHAAGMKIIAYDLPSGMDATSGRCLRPCVCAYATLSLALPKAAFRKTYARKICGKIFLADIGIPEFLYDRVSSGSRPDFKHSAGLIRI